MAVGFSGTPFLNDSKHHIGRVGNQSDRKEYTMLTRTQIYNHIAHDLEQMRVNGVVTLAVGIAILAALTA